MIFGAVLAGGIGSRMNISDMPKQFLPLGDRPIIIHTLEKFLMCNKFDKIYIGIHSDWVCHMKDIINKYGLDCGKFELVCGGSDRNETIQNIISAIEKQYGQDDDNIIVTHDSVRPFVSLKMIEDNIEALKEYEACDTVSPSVDTIVVSHDNNVISSVPNRNFMYQGQTPQSFKVSLLKRLYNDLSAEEKSELTDACKICVIRKVPVKLVQGDVSNLKITTVSDYKIAQAMLGGMKVD